MIKVLDNAGFDRSLPTFFSILGVTYYLTFSEFRKTVSKISELSRGGNKLVFDFPDETTFTGNTAGRVRHLTQITAKLGEPMKHGFSIAEIRDLLNNTGFAVTRHETPEKIQKRFFENNRERSKLKAFENIHLILAEKKEEN